MNYNLELEKKLLTTFNEISKTLPSFCKEFFIGISQTTSIRTRVGYAYDLKLFFSFLCEEIQELKSKDVYSLKTNDLEKVKPLFIDEFLDYLSLYSKENKFGEIVSYSNRANAKSRKLSAVRALFKYLHKTEKIKNNPTSLVNTPKIKSKEIVHLEPNEVASLLDIIEDGKSLTKHQKKYHEYTKTRDFAIISLLLGTGIRISECVGINISDIDFNVNGIKIIRKGGNQSIIYFGEEVEEAILKYLNKRKVLVASKNDEDALFLSMQKKRISVRAVQNLTKKYSSIVTPLKNISPHKLRSTYGTTLYEETGDIYLVADALGHSDVNTTKKHYAKMSDENRRRAAKVVKLRKN